MKCDFWPSGLFINVRGQCGAVDIRATMVDGQIESIHCAGCGAYALNPGFVDSMTARVLALSRLTTAPAPAKPKPPAAAFAKRREWWKR